MVPSIAATNTHWIYMGWAGLAGLVWLGLHSRGVVYVTEAAKHKG